MRRLSIAIGLSLSIVGCADDLPTAPAPDAVADPAAGPAGVGHFEQVPTRAAPRPTRLAPAPDGILYLSDTVAGRVVGIRAGETVVALSDLDRPLGVAIDGDLLYVGSAGRGAVDAYSLSARAWSHALGGGAGAFELPNAIAVAPDGQVYVADSKAHTVRVFTRAGAALRTIGALGDGPHQLRFPAAVAVDDERVYVGDQGNHRVQVYDRAGAWLHSLGGPLASNARSVQEVAARFTRIQGLALHGERLYVLDAFHAHVQILDLSGASRGFIARPGHCETCLGLGLDVAVDWGGRVLVADPDHRRWLSLNAAPEVLP
jgi:hypothetical protein